MEYKLLSPECHERRGVDMNDTIFFFRETLSIFHIYCMFFTYYKVHFNSAHSFV